jgi:hypothetical protein
MLKKVMVIVIGLALLGVAFFGGTLVASSSAPAGMPEGAGGRAGGPIVQLSEEEQAQLESMTDEERQAFMQEQRGGQAPGGTGGPAGRGGGLVEGEVVDVAADSVTIKLADGSSQTVYTDTDTVVGYEDGAAEMAAGSAILVFSESSADNVVTAQAILVTK